MRQWLQELCRYQLDSIVTNGLVHTAAAVAVVPQVGSEPILCGIGSSTLHSMSFVAAQNGIQLIAAPLPQPLPHRVNEPLTLM